MKKLIIVLIFLCILLQFSSAQGAFKKEHLSAYWKMDESTGTRYDSTPNNNDLNPNRIPGIGVGPVFRASGIINGALKTDSGQIYSGYLESPSSDSLSPQTSLAICFWFYTSSDYHSERRTLIEKEGAYLFEAKQQEVPREWPPRLIFTVRQSNYVERYLEFKGFGKNRWFHVCGIADNSKAYLYIQGSERVTTDFDNTFYQYTSPIYVGGKVSSDIGYIFNGNIDEVGIWKDIHFNSDQERQDFVTSLFNPLGYDNRGAGVTYETIMRGACGDFTKDTDEGCDDGNILNGDGCSFDCQLEVSGCANEGSQFSKVFTTQYPFNCCSGLTEWNSGMDTRKVVDGVCVQTGLASGSPIGTCINCGNHICEPIETICNCPDDCNEVCGDTQVQAGEECDDGNTINTDSCISCKTAYCGDSFTRTGIEQCDDGNLINTDSCISCTNAICGDTFIYTGVEQCDDGNTNNNDGCSSTCRIERCGDQILQAGEQCDLGTQNGVTCNPPYESSCTYCNLACQQQTIQGAFCGDDLVQPAYEECDYGVYNSDEACRSNPEYFCVYCTTDCREVISVNTPRILKTVSMWVEDTESNIKDMTYQIVENK